MRNILHLTSVLLIVGLTVNAAGKKSDAYFRHLSLDSKLAYVGKYAVDEKYAKETNCYHFQYDDMGKLETIEYLKSGKLQSDISFGVAQTKIEYTDNYEKRTFYNAKGKPTADAVSGVYSVRVKYNESTHLLSLFNYDKKGFLTKDKYSVTQYAWLLDNDGKRLKSMRMDRTGTRIVDNEGFYELRAKYDEQGKLLELANYGKDGKLMGNKGKVSILHKKYDEKGNILEEAYLSDKGELVNHTVNKIAVSQIRYDNNGNMTETKYMGSDEQLKEDKSGVAVTRWKYDSSGNLIEESYYGIDEQPKERKAGENLSYAAVRWKYDSQGKLVQTTYLNKKQLMATTASAN